MAKTSSGINLPELHIREGLDADVLQVVAAGDTAMVMAGKIAALAKAIAPVLTGRYRDGIKVEKTELKRNMLGKSFVYFYIPDDEFNFASYYGNIENCKARVEMFDL